MTMKIRPLNAFLVLILLAGCASTKIPRAWISSPPAQRGENRSFKATLEPLKGGERFFVSFRLSVRNKTDKTLRIDWNRTRYIYQGRPNGGFVFRGIDPAAIKGSSIPPDPIRPGELFSKEIFPTSLVAFTPFRDVVTDKQGKGIQPGPIPAGENGISLAIRQGEREMVERILLNIRAVSQKTQRGS
ncbi:MAG: hypothetical protein JRF51_10745 [Deltaproteobacteria bacterium]|nr:hypothetical protein [Deltaproteobacteria bacterium]